MHGVYKQSSTHLLFCRSQCILTLLSTEQEEMLLVAEQIQTNTESLHHRLQMLFDCLLIAVWKSASQQ